MASYGLPYQGSKNAIAEWVVERLPPAPCLADLFSGGGAVTHCAIKSGKYGRFLMNDIDGRLPVAFDNVINRKIDLRQYERPVTREEFKLTDDILIKILWSFGNNLVDYIYAENVQDYKLLAHKMLVAPTVKERRLLFIKLIRAIAESGRLDERIQALERTEALESVARCDAMGNGVQYAIETHGGDYRTVDIPDGAVVYCDIPYKGTETPYVKGFDHGAFYEWALARDDVFISEYDMPGDFVLLAEKEKNVLCSNRGTEGKATERLYTTVATVKRYGLRVEREQTLF